MKEMDDLKVEEMKAVEIEEMAFNNETQERYLIFEELLQRYNEGDHEAAGEIITRIEPMIMKRCKHYFGYVDEDLMQQGRMRCIILIQRYDRNFVGVKFLGYLNRMLSCYFWDLKKLDLKKERFEQYYGENEQKRLYEIKYDEAGYDEVELESLISCLNEKERYVVRANILIGKKLIDTAKELGISYEYSKDIKKSALKKLRNVVAR